MFQQEIFSKWLYFDKVVLNKNIDDIKKKGHKMRKMDRDGRILCDIQARLFEESNSKLDTSSKIFVRRFMNSHIVTEFDSVAFLDDTKTIFNVFDKLEEEYGYSSYGTIKYHPDVMYWVGYVYRYFAYCYKISSKRAYKYLPFDFIASSYEGFHSLDVSQAVERLLEARGISLKEEALFQKGLELLRKMHQQRNL